MTENQQIAQLLEDIHKRLAQMRNEYKAILSSFTDSHGSHRSQPQVDNQEDSIAA
jgi:hypothetical protein